MKFVPSDEQAAIIAHGLEPLRVTAGAGTGKTTTLAYRMIELIERFGILPEQVLGVTFTNKAAGELAHRIRQVRGGFRMPSQEVEVFTYHGFATHLLGMYGVLVGLEQDVRIISPTVTRQMLRDCLIASPFEALDATNVTRVIGSLASLSGALADNLLRPHDLLVSPPSGEVDVRRAELATALVEFERIKQKFGVCDYGDLIRLAVDLVSGHPTIAQRIRNRYRCVLLDEYQDTNPAQRELFAQLFGEHGAVTAVGDLDQTIYEWRGASRSNFESFPSHFRPADGHEARTLRLSYNRRSRQRILDLANRVRARISGTDQSGDLAALPGTSPGEVRVAWYYDARREAEEIARETHRLHGNGTAWSDMAVLFRRNRDMELVRLAFEEHEIPHQVADLGGLLQVPEIVEIHAWMRLLADPEDTPALVRILLGSRFRLGLSDLVPLSRWVKKRSNTDDPRARPTFVEALEHLDRLDLAPEARRSLYDFHELYRMLLTELQGESLPEIARSILSRTDAWQEIDAIPGPSKLSVRLNVHRFLDFTEQWRPLEGRSSLESFLEHLQFLREEPRDQLEAARIGDDEAVTLMTVHRAKGLEWDAIFLPALLRGTFPATPRLLEDPADCEFAVPAPLRIDAEFRNNLDPSIDRDQRRAWLRGRHQDQEWRLAYVACTRARAHLYLSGAHWYGAPQVLKRASKPSELLELARQVDGVAVDEWVTEVPPRPATLQFPPAQPGPDPVLGVSWEDALHNVVAEPDWAAERAEGLGIGELYDTAVADFEQTILDLPEPAQVDPGPRQTAVSVTGLVTYATCPKRYYWSEVDRLPRRPGPAARRGDPVAPPDRAAQPGDGSLR